MNGQISLRVVMPQAADRRLMYPGGARAAFDYGTQVHKAHLLSLFLFIDLKPGNFREKNILLGRLTKKRYRDRLPNLSS